MPGYNTHRIFNYLIFIAAVLFLNSFGIFQVSPIQLLAIGLGFYIGTEFVTPDLDTDSSAHKRWGRLRILMIPYKWLFKHRKSFAQYFFGGDHKDNLHNRNNCSFLLSPFQIASS
jgi:uncharacterized metal-binding protein